MSDGQKPVSLENNYNIGGENKDYSQNGFDRFRWLQKLEVK